MKTERNAPARALVVRLSSIGDVVHTLPAFMALRRSWPSTELGWAVEPAAAPLVERLPGPLRVHVLDTHCWRRRWLTPGVLREAWAAFRDLRRQRYELALDFQGLVKSAFIARASGAPVVGLDRGDLREPFAARFYSRLASPAGTNEHVIHRSLGLVRAVGGRADELEWPTLTDDDDEAYVERELDDAGIAEFVTLHTACNWPSKQWPEERWVESGRALYRETGLPVLWIWGPGEQERNARLVARAGEGNRLAFPTSLTQLLALLGRARLFVGGDSAPLHLAVAVGTPTVGLFGPTNPARNGSVRAGDHAVHRSLPCSFCHQRRCPLGTVECLWELPSERLVEASVARLHRAGNEPPRPVELSSRRTRESGADG